MRIDERDGKRERERVVLRSRVVRSARNEVLSRFAIVAGSSEMVKERKVVMTEPLGNPVQLNQTRMRLY